MKWLERAGYKLLQEIGCGAMGRVYKATSPAGKIVAVKVLNAGARCGEQELRRFRKEFEAARRMHHPHVVRYLSFDAEQGHPFLVMEYVEGVSLWKRVQEEGPLSRADTLRLAAQLSSALDAAHEQNILHRDLKPNNVLLTRSGDAKLIDFGLVKDLNESKSITDHQAILGTPFFMAPEQFFNAKGVDRRADVYGLAATLFYALTGKMPFKFKGAGLLEKKLNGQFYPPGDEPAEIPPGLLKALGRGLAAEPTRRPASCGELLCLMRAVAKPAPKTPAAEERRSVPRRVCDFQGSSAVGGGAELPARVVDISTEGLCLLTSRSFPPMAVLDLSFHFSDGGEPWDYQARVVNVRQLDGRRWRHGCRFLEPVDRAELLALLKEEKGNVRIRVCWPASTSEHAGAPILRVAPRRL